MKKEKIQKNWLLEIKTFYNGGIAETTITTDEAK